MSLSQGENPDQGNDPFQNVDASHEDWSKNDATHHSANIPDERKYETEDVLEWLHDDDEEEDNRISLGLIGKLWSERILNPTAFMATIKNVWVTQHGFDVNMIGKNLYQFQFYHWRDKEKVLRGQPWHFERVAILLAEMESTQ